MLAGKHWNVKVRFLDSSRSQRPAAGTGHHEPHLAATGAALGFAGDPERSVPRLASARGTRQTSI